MEETFHAVLPLLGGHSEGRSAEGREKIFLSAERIVTLISLESGKSFPLSREGRLPMPDN